LKCHNVNGVALRGVVPIRSAAAFVILILSGFCAPLSGATVYHSDGSAADVQRIHDTQAHDGDTITLPAGTFSWTSSSSITKGITLQGKTTVIGAGAPNPTVTDVTIIKDDVPRNSGILSVSLNGSRLFRMTGITFAPDSQVWAATDGAFHFSSTDSTARVRIDHCHFASLNQAKIIWNSQVWGVADHNAIEVIRNSFPFNNDGAIMGLGENGNGSWADYPWYGTDKFFFIEDNTLVRHNSSLPNSLVDSYFGGRFVARHNYMENMIPSGHGTEGGAARGQRASEFYDNTIKITIPWSGGGQRSGTSLWHDNTFIGLDSVNGSMCNLPNYRETPARGIQTPGTFTVADGTCPWDQNDTEGNGTHVEGHPPFLFDSGSPTSGTTISGGTGTFTDSTKHWTTNQWAGFSIRDNNPNSASYKLGSYIISNTSNSITYSYYGANDVNVHLIFNAGGRYQIHRVLVMMDQNGRGRTLDAIYTQIINGQPHPINPRCGCALWPRSQLEPCYSWNNVYTPTNHVLGFGGGGQPTTKPGIDYFNLGGGFPADTTPAAVSATYTAAINGANYTGPYVYPHPLVSGQPAPSPAPTPRLRQHLQKKGKKGWGTKKKKKEKATEHGNNPAEPLGSPP
jgi:hypothetical protein